jgi:hypothetical protein
VTLDLPTRAHCLAPEHRLALACAAAPGVKDRGFCGDSTRGKESEMQRLGSCRTDTCWGGVGSRWIGCPDWIRPDDVKRRWACVPCLVPLALCCHGQAVFSPGQSIEIESRIPQSAASKHDGWRGKVRARCAVVRLAASAWNVLRGVTNSVQESSPCSCVHGALPLRTCEARPAGSFWREHECRNGGTSRSAGTATSERTKSMEGASYSD